MGNCNIKIFSKIAREALIDRENTLKFQKRQHQVNPCSILVLVNRKVPQIAPLLSVLQSQRLSRAINGTIGDMGGK